MSSYFWLCMAYAFATLWLPFFLAAWAWRMWDRCASRFWRTAGAVVFWLLILWVLGWILQWMYRTHIWYSWAAQPEALMN